MRQNIIDIKAESFPWYVKLIGALFLFVALMVMLDYWWLSIILVAAGLTLLTGYSGTEVDLVNKTFREYNSYLFIRTGATEKYDRIE
jgi:predicted Zn-dependent protease